MKHLKSVLLFAIITCASIISTNAQTYTLNVDNQSCGDVEMDIVLTSPGTFVRCLPAGGDYVYAPASALTSHSFTSGAYIDYLNVSEVSNTSNFIASMGPPGAYCSTGGVSNGTFPTMFMCSGMPTNANLNVSGSVFTLTIW